MKQWMTFAAIAFTLLVVATFLEASPATQPSKPNATAKKRVDANATVYTCESLGFAFSAPKTWDVLQENTSSGRFELNMNAADPIREQRPGAKPPPMTIANFEVHGGTPCHGDATLDEQTKAFTDSLVKSSHAKTVTDEPATLANEPARLVVLEYMDEFTSTEKGKEVKVPLKMREHYIVSVRNGKRYMVWLLCDAASYEKQKKLFNRALATFEWLSP